MAKQRNRSQQPRRNAPRRTRQDKRKQTRVAAREECIALAFQREEGLRYCIELLLTERRDVRFDLPGRGNVIIPKAELPWFEKKLTAERHAFETVPVVSATALSPERLAELRAQYGKPARPEYGDVEWKKKRIADLKQHQNRS